MRYPKIPWMKTTFELFKYLELDRTEILIPYHLDDPLGNNLRHFNNVSKSSSQLQTANAQGDFDPFRTKVVGLTESVDDLLGKKLDPFKRKLAKDFQMGWENLMSADQLSMRDWLAMGIKTKPYSEQVSINRCLSKRSPQ